MAHYQVTLTNDDQSSNSRWTGENGVIVYEGNSTDAKWRIPAGLAPSGATNRFLRQVQIRYQAIYVRIARSDTNANADLSSTFETGVRIGIEANGERLILEPARADTSSIYTWTLGDNFPETWPGTNIVVSGTGRDIVTRDLVLTLWDGQGDTPFTTGDAGVDKVYDGSTLVIVYDGPARVKVYDGSVRIH